ncbi:MAG TPA: hypothetical protein VGJ15_13365 [Pirellulales bacterium]|jgi:predicted RNase H-like nuclease (RuvC/YqgF family)
MKKLFVAVSVLLLAVVIAASRNLNAAGEDAPKDDGLTQAKVAYAQAMVKVAEAVLNSAQQANRQASAAVPSSVVQGLQNDLAMAKARVKYFQDGSAGGSEAPYRTAARDALADAESRLKQTNDTNARLPGTINNAELARRQAEVDLAKARLDVCQYLDKATDIQRMQWEIMLLQEDVHKIQTQIGILQHQN